MSSGEQEPRTIDELATRRGGLVVAEGEQLSLVGRSDGASGLERSSYGPLVIDALRAGTSPVPGRDGWRIDPNGVEWFSSAWLGLHE